MADLREPKETVIIDGSGKERKFILSKMNAWDGLEIVARYPASLALSAIPKVSDWSLVQDLQLKILKHVAVDLNGHIQPLSTVELVINHTGDWECLVKLLKEEVQYNTSFFQNGTASDFFAEAFRLALAKISEILTQSSAPSSPTTKQPSTNSGQSIA